MISSFVVRMYKRFVAFANMVYASSKLKIINDKTVSSVVKASSNSLICQFLSSEPKTNKYYNSSIMSSIARKVCSFFRLMSDKIKPLFDNSLIFASIKQFCNNILNLPLSVYGTFLLIFGLVSAIRFAFDTLQFLSVAVIIFSILCGFCMLFVRTSLNRILSSSKIVDYVTKVFSKNIIFADCFEKDAVKPKVSHYLLSGILGIFWGIASFFIPAYILFAGIFAFAFVVLVIRDFRLGAYFVIMLFPFAPTMAVVGVLLLSLISLFIRMCFDGEFVFSRTGLDIYIVLFSVIICISGVTSFDRATSVNIALVYIVFILSYFVFTNTIVDKKSLYISFSMLITGGILVSLYGIYQYVFGFSGGNVWIDTGMFTGIETRVVSTFENPNVLGEYLLIIIPLAIAYFFESDSIKGKWASLFALAILILCMVFTFSRGCWIGLIVSFGVMSLFYDRRFVWAGLILLLLSPLYLPESIIQRFLSVGDTSDTSTSYRVYIWFGTLAMLKDYWLTGIGLGEGAFNVIYPHYSYSAIVAPHSHNLYLQVIVENGICGFILFILLIIAFYKNSIYALTNTKRGFLKVSLLALVSAVTGYLIQGLFDNVWYNYRVFMFFFMAIAITMKCAFIASKNNCVSRGEQDD